MIYQEVIKGSHTTYIASDFVKAPVSANKSYPLVICNIPKDLLQAVKNVVVDLYGDKKQITVGVDNKEEDISILDIKDGSYDYFILGSEEIMEIQRFDFLDLYKIMRRLRADDGCEWDKVQTHESIRINLIEEAYELVDAIDNKDNAGMLEECGDVLLQGVFHAAIAEDNKEFTVNDMLTGLCRKLVDRHTHIFGKNHANNADEALFFWQEAKKKEKKYKSSSDAMSRVPNNFPALLYAEKIQKIAKKAGFDWKEVEPAGQKVIEELNEVLEADKEHKVEECGDLLFAAVNVCRLSKVEPEMALKEANKKFERRFNAVEKLANERNIQMTPDNLEQLDALWDEVKSKE